MKTIAIVFTVLGFLVASSLGNQPRLPLILEPDLILEYYALPDKANAELPRFVVIYNPHRIQPPMVKKFIATLKLKSRCQVVSKIQNGVRRFGVFPIHENEVLVEGDGRFDFLLPRELFYYALRGEIEINWKRWSSVVINEK